VSSRRIGGSRARPGSPFFCCLPQCGGNTPRASRAFAAARPRCPCGPCGPRPSIALEEADSSSGSVEVYRWSSKWPLSPSSRIVFFLVPLFNVAVSHVLIVQRGCLELGLGNHAAAPRELLRGHEDSFHQKLPSRCDSIWAQTCHACQRPCTRCSDKPPEHLSGQLAQPNQDHAFSKYQEQGLTHHGQGNIASG
jgi:hypothetical protein